MSEHTPTPWVAARKYSSIAGVPIVNQAGKRIANTALPDMPPAWKDRKRQAEIDAAFIVRAVNAYGDLIAALDEARLQIEYMQEKFQSTSTGVAVLARIDAALSKAKEQSNG